MDPVQPSAKQKLLDRRANYRRSNTLDILPVSALTATPVDHCRNLTTIEDSPVRETPLSLSVPAVSGESVHRLATGRDAVSTCQKTNVNKRSTFHRKTSCSDLLLTGRHDNRLATDAVEVPSSGLLSKVKDRILETMFQTSTEWPAVIQERRQKAAEHYEAAVRCRLQQQNRIQRHSDVSEPLLPRTRTSPRADHKNPTSAVAAAKMAAVNKREASRIAYRRRSVSCEDTIMEMTGNMTSNKCTGSPAGGIICSNDDFRSIIELSRSQMKHDAVTSLSDVTDQQLAAVDWTCDDVRQELSPVTSRSAGCDRRRSSAASSNVDLSPKSVRPDKQASRHSIDAVSNKSDHSFHSTRDVTLTPDRNHGNAAAGGPPEVVFDEHGQTWDVYGAELDPEILGEAIEIHLEKIMSTGTDGGKTDGDDRSCRATSQSRCGKLEADPCCVSDNRRTHSLVVRFLYLLSRRRRSHNLSTSS